MSEMGFDFGEAFAGRPLKFFWLLDVSDSMNHDGKIASLNQAIRSCIKPMQDVAEDNPEAQMLVRAAAGHSTSGLVEGVSQPGPSERALGPPNGCDALHVSGHQDPVMRCAHRP